MPNRTELMIAAVAVLGVAAVIFAALSNGPIQAMDTKVPPAAELGVASSEPQSEDTTAGEKQFSTATFGGGCFWCVEAVFQKLEGVEEVVSGYSGGKLPNPSYEAVCTGNTGHAEVVQIKYDPAKISFAELLEVFWATHDPTTLNRQGNDVGTQYRSVIFYHNEKQKELAASYKKKLDDAKAFPKPIVTEISPLGKFYPAENYHQDYFRLNGRQPYCQFVVKPKVDKVEKVFKDKLKKE